MILIADAGATSIDWRLIMQDGQITQARTNGYNAYQQSEQDLMNSVHEAIQTLQVDQVTELYFYGAGISGKTNEQKTLAALQRSLKSDRYYITHDLLAAARALFLDQPGIACILGTGTNSCFYDGNKISEIIPSLGYAIGDEGSGAALGRRLVKAYLRRDLPKDIRGLFEKRFELTEDQFLLEVYQGKSPAQYLASFSKFLFHHRKNPFIYQLIYKEFELFFDEILKKYAGIENHKVAFSGSVAFYYSDILRQVGNDKGIVISNIVESPIAGLTLYHQKQQES